MRKILGLMCFIFASVYAQSYYSPDKPVHVDGYTRHDGTIVKPYYRAKPHHGSFHHHGHR